MEDTFILECRDVAFAYPGDAPVFSQVDLKVPPGSFVEIRGPSGAGKSTFLRLLNRLASPSRGSILYRNRELEDYLPPILRREVTYLQQTPSLIHGSVRQNLLLPFDFGANQDRTLPTDDKLKEGLSRFLLDGVRLDNPAHNLSVGQRQRLCLFRAILLEPKILLLDEPTSALDQESREAVQEIVNRLSTDSNMTIFLVAHTEFKVEAKNTLTGTLAQGRMTIQ